MCGKDSASTSFNPENLDVDIYVRQAIGLGRGKGFSFGPDETVLGDDHYTPKVMDRCMELLKAGIEKGSVTRREIASQLKIGAPIQGKEDVIPYEDILRWVDRQNQALKGKNTSLERQVSTARSGVSLSQHEQLRKRYEKLEGYMRNKKKTDEVLLYLHRVLDSEIAYKGDDWILEVYEYNEKFFAYLCKELYASSREERDMLQSRMITADVIYDAIFWMFNGEPTIKSVTDRLTKRPGKLYYQIYDLPFPNYLIGI